MKAAAVSAIALPVPGAGCRCDIRFGWCSRIFRKIFIPQVYWSLVSFSMVGPSRNSLVVGTPKHTRVEPASQHPWRPDPNDDGVPICPPDTSVHEPLLGRIERVQKVVVHKIGFQFQTSKDAAQQVIGYVLAARHCLADRFGLPEQGFGLRRFHFHDSTVGRLAVK